MSQQLFGRFKSPLKNRGSLQSTTDCSATTGWCFQVWQRLPSIGTPLSAIFMGHHIFQIHWRYLRPQQIQPKEKTQQLANLGRDHHRFHLLQTPSLGSPHRRRTVNHPQPPPWGPGATRSGPCRSDSPQGRKGGTRHGDVAASMEV